MEAARLIFAGWVWLALTGVPALAAAVGKKTSKTSFVFSLLYVTNTTASLSENYPHCELWIVFLVAQWVDALQLGLPELSPDHRLVSMEAAP